MSCGEQPPAPQQHLHLKPVLVGPQPAKHPATHHGPRCVVGNRCPACSTVPTPGSSVTCNCPGWVSSLPWIPTLWVGGNVSKSSYMGGSPLCARHRADAMRPTPTDRKAGVTAPLDRWGNRGSEGPTVPPRPDGYWSTETGAISGLSAPGPAPGRKTVGKMRK